MSKRISSQPAALPFVFAALAWLLAGTSQIPACAGEAGGTPLVGAKTNPQARLQVVEQSLAGIRQTLARAQQDLGSILEACGSLPLAKPENQERERELRERMAQLQKEIAEITALLSNATGGVGTGEPLRVAEEVARAKARNEILRQEIAQYAGVPPFRPVPADAQAVEFVLIGNRITPLDKEHFQGQGALHEGKRYVIIKKIQDGQLMSEALSPGGCLEKCLSEIDPRQKYVTLLVCPDGVNCFDAVAKAIKKRDVMCVWEAIQELPWVVPLDTGGGAPQPPDGRIGF